MSRISPASPHHGKATSAASMTTAATAKMRLAQVPRSTRSVSMSVSRAREQPARPNDQDNQKGDVPSEDLPGRRQRGTDRLRDAQDHAADQRAPHAAEAADDHRFKRQNQPDWTGRRIEVRSDRKQHAGDRGEDHRDAQRNGVELAVVDAHQLGGVGIVGDGAKSAPEAGAVEQKLQAAEREQRDAENQERIDADRDAAELQARSLDRALLEPLGVGAEALQQPVLDDDRNAEGHQK